MAFPTVNSCCLCASLRTGCLIIGWLAIVISILGIGGSSAAASEYAPAGGGPGLIGLIFSILLLVGTYKRKPEFLMPYIIVNSIMVIMAVLLFILFVFLSGDKIQSLIKNDQDMGYNTLRSIILVALATYAVLHSYFVVVVNSYRRVLTGDLVDNSWA